jgi:exopolysaccharide production protein ExoZ
MVVLSHAINPRGWLFNPLEGYDAFAWGVDIFFVISGFIMFVAARNENHIDFLGRRIIRVVPLYWGATFVLLIIKTNFHVWQINSETFAHFIKSLFFVPHYSPSFPDELWPYLVLGWTLNYEMLFYLIFFLGLMIQRALIVTTISILSLFILGVFIEPQNAILEAYTRPILLEFLLGVWVARAYLNGSLNKNCSALIFIGLGGLLLTPFVIDENLIMAGRIVCSTLIIVGAVSLGKRVAHNKLLNLIGDASYSIYLTHTIFSLRWFSKIWHHAPIEGWPQFAGWVILSLVLSSAVGIIIYLYVEKPIIKWLRTKWKVVIKKLSRKRRADNTDSDFA